MKKAKFSYIIKQSILNTILEKHEGEDLINMSNIEWFKNEVELVNEFLHKTSGLIAIAEAYDVKYTALAEEKAKLQEEISSSQNSIYDGASAMYEQTKLNVLSIAMNEVEVELKEKLQALQTLKETYMAEELLDTIETLTSIEEGEPLGDMACEVIKVMNLLMRKHNMSYM